MIFAKICICVASLCFSTWKWNIDPTLIRSNQPRKFIHTDQIISITLLFDMSRPIGERLDFALCWPLSWIRPSHPHSIGQPLDFAILLIEGNSNSWISLFSAKDKGIKKLELQGERTLYKQGKCATSSHGNLWKVSLWIWPKPVS